MSGPVRPVIFGKYCLLERISVGGMAEVFRARPFNAPGFKRFLAVKRILPNLAEDEAFISMFVDEAKIAVQLNHKRVCQIYELGRLQDSFYIVMEYIAGKNLLHIQNHFRAQKKMMSVTQAAFIAQGICEGLDYAHRKRSDDGQPLGIVHRDISPQNILVSYDGEVKVIDFGIARAATKNKQTQAGVLKGKFGYMSPEQANGLEVDHRSDIFAVGALLWEMLTSRRLFQGKTDFQTLEQVRAGDIEPPSAKNSRVPPEIDRIVLRALDRNPETRYQWASEFADDLRAFLSSIQPAFTETTLSRWMCSNFAEDLAAEHERIPLFAPFVTVQDVMTFNDQSWEEIDGDELEALEEEGATQVVDGERPVALRKPKREFVLAENEEEPMATVVLNLDDVRLPSRPLDIDELTSEGTATRLTGSVPAITLAPPVARRRSNATVWLALIAVLLVVAAVGLYALSLQNTGGTVRIQTTPADGVRVSINGVPQEGSPPLEITGIAPGPVVVTLNHPDFVPVTEQIEVVAGNTVLVDRRLAPQLREGTVRLALTQPAAQVYLDGELLPGEGSAREFVAPAGGEHTLEVFVPGHFVETYDFTLSAGATFERSVTLRPVRGELTVRSNPGGELFLNGESRGQTTDWLTVPDLDPAGSYTLEIRPAVPGYRPFSQTFVFDTYYQPRNSVVLRRIGDATPDPVVEVGMLTTGDADRWYRVFIDGRDSGFITPITAEAPLPLKTGERAIRFVRAGDERSITVQVQAGQTLRVDIPPR